MSMRFELPAVKGRQGDRVYYMASVPFSVLGRLLEIDTGNPLDRSQREVDSKRAMEIVNYYFHNRERYVLPSLTGIIEDSTLEFKDAGGGAGVLSVDMAAVIKLFDGQHRATAITHIAKQVKFRSMWEHQTVGIQLFVGMNLQDRQQAFSDINSKAKAVSKSLNLAYDARNTTVAQFRELAAQIYRAFGVDFDKNIVSKGSIHFFSFKHLVDAWRFFLGMKTKDSLKEDQIELIKKWFDGEASRAVHLGQHANQNVISITRTGMGIMVVARLFRYAVGEGISPEVFAEKLKDIDFSKDNPLWLNICVDAKGRMIPSKEAIKKTASVAVVEMGYRIPLICPALD